MTETNGEKMSEERSEYDAASPGEGGAERSMNNLISDMSLASLNPGTRRDISLHFVKMAKLIEDLKDALNSLGYKFSRADEELADSVTAYQRVIDDKCPDDELHCTCVPFLRRRIKELETAGWIPLVDRAPELRGEYLVVLEYREERHRVICEWDGDWRTVGYVIYWMPMPKIPVEVKK